MSDTQEAGSSVVRVDKRGLHWKSKVESGESPEPWKHTKWWSEQKVAIMHKFTQTAAQFGMQHVRLPWEFSGSPVIGNRSKVLWMHLMMCGWTGDITEVRFSPRAGDGFMGIMQFRVPKEKLEAFNSQMFPFSSAPILEGQTVKRKTVVKNWQSAGLKERTCVDGSVLVCYDDDLYKRMKDQLIRADNRRRAMKNPTDNPSSTTEGVDPKDAMLLINLCNAPPAPPVVTSSSNPSGPVSSSVVPPANPVVSSGLPPSNSVVSSGLPLAVRPSVVCGRPPIPASMFKAYPPSMMGASGALNRPSHMMMGASGILNRPSPMMGAAGALSLPSSMMSVSGASSLPSSMMGSVSRRPFAAAMALPSINSVAAPPASLGTLSVGSAREIIRAAEERIARAEARYVEATNRIAEAEARFAAAEAELRAANAAMRN